MRNRLIVAVVMIFAPLASADPHELRLPLRDGRLSTAQLSDALVDRLGIDAPALGSASINVRSVGGSLFVAALNRSLGRGATVSADGESLRVCIDPAYLPASGREAKQAVRTFTKTVRPLDAARQAAMFGMKMPETFDPAKPLVVLIHGVDCTRDCMAPMADDLSRDGWQIAFFGYPDDQPIADSAKLLVDDLKIVRDKFPNMPIDLVCFSMGGLVAREAVEGPTYPGGVKHLIQLAPPNHGSKLAVARPLLELREQYSLWRTCGDWRWTWAITDGLGEAGADMQPGSVFLRQLNERTRRDGVQYTIINGNVHPIEKTSARLATAAVRVVGPTVGRYSGLSRLAKMLT